MVALVVWLFFVVTSDNRGFYLAQQAYSGVYCGFNLHVPDDQGWSTSLALHISFLVKCQYKSFCLF